MKLSRGHFICILMILVFLIAMLFVLPFKVWLVGVVAGIFGIMLNVILSKFFDRNSEEE